MSRYALTNALLVTSIVALVACTAKRPPKDAESFTEIDSLTEVYLTLEDSMLNSWNAIVRDENEKIRSLHELLHTLMADHQNDVSVLSSLEQRLDQLEQLRFDQKTMDDPHIVEEYDFASNSLINEIITFAEATPAYAKKENLQELVGMIKTADQHIPLYRADYDSAAVLFNEFLEHYHDELGKLDESLSKEKRPLF